MSTGRDGRGWLPLPAIIALGWLTISATVVIATRVLT